MVTAYWHGMKWELSPKRIAYLDGLATSYEMETETNADKEGNAATENVGMKDQEIALSTTYRIETGTRNVRGMIAKWKALVGKADSLVIGSKTFGPNKVQLQSVSVSDLKIRPDGVFSAVTLSFKFKEYKAETKKTTKKTTSSSTKKTKSAVSVGSTKSDKKSKKTVKTVLKDE